MISLARKNLLREKLRFLISVGGVAFSVMLILVLLGLYRGWNEKLGRYIEGVDADVWVLQKGASDMFHSTSIVQDSLLQELVNLTSTRRNLLSTIRCAILANNSQAAHLRADI